MTLNFTRKKINYRQSIGDQCVRNPHWLLFDENYSSTTFARFSFNTLWKLTFSSEFVVHFSISYSISPHSHTVTCWTSNLQIKMRVLSCTLVWIIVLYATTSVRSLSLYNLFCHHHQQMHNELSGAKSC